MVAQTGLGRAVEPDRPALQVVGQPLRPGPAGADRGVDHLTGGGHRLGQRLVDGTAPGHQYQRGGGERIRQVGHQSLGVGRDDLPGFADHHHAPVDQEGGVVQASITTPTSNWSTPGPPNSSTIIDGSPPATSRSTSEWAAWATRDGSAPLTR